MSDDKTVPSGDPANEDEEYQRVLKIFMTTFYKVMCRCNIENYMEVTGGFDGQDRQVVLTVRWKDGLTPVQRYDRHLNMLRIELEQSESARMNLLAQLDELKAKIEAAPVDVRSALGWTEGTAHGPKEPK